MFTTEGGVEIEQVAAENPDALVRVHVDPLEGFEPHHLRELLVHVTDEGERSRSRRSSTSCTAASSSPTPRSARSTR